MMIHIKKRELFSNIFFLCAAFSLLACITRTGGKAARADATGRADVAGRANAAVPADVPPVDPWALITEDRAFTVQDEARPGEPVAVIFAAANGGPAASGLKAALWTAAGGTNAGGRRLSGSVFVVYQTDEAHFV
jgi:hypothetical protein